MNLEAQWKEIALHNSAHSRPPKGQKQVRFFLVVVALAGGLIALALVLFNGLGGAGREVFSDPALQDAALPDGSNASQFDPVASYPQMVTIAGDGAQLIRITAYFVKSDGTVDLTVSYAKGVEYDFGLKLATAPKDAPPLGAGGSQSGDYYQPIYLKVFGPAQHRSISQGVERIASAGYLSVTPTLAPAPTCTFKRLWSAAIEKGVPRDAVAEIDYYSTGYHFSIDGTFIRISYDLDCKITSSAVSLTQAVPTIAPPATEVPAPAG